jgi:hypothetical protein
LRRRLGKEMNKFLLIGLISLILPITSIAQDALNPGYVDVTVEYRAMFPGNLQIRDGVCKPSRDIECERARIKVAGDFCLQNPTKHQCVEAGMLLGSSFCIEGLIFDEEVVVGEKVKVSICTSSAGFATLFVRNIRNGLSWTYYPLLKNNDTITYY